MADDDLMCLAASLLGQNAVIALRGTTRASRSQAIPRAATVAPGTARESTDSNASRHIAPTSRVSLVRPTDGGIYRVAGEQQWLAERFEEQRGYLWAVAYRMPGSLAEADDAVQDTWLRVRGVARRFCRLGAARRPRDTHAC